MSSALTDFVAGESGLWRVESVRPVTGPGLSYAPRLSVREDAPAEEAKAPEWRLRGITSNVRYTNRAEVAVLTARQENLGRAEASRAALIPIKKTSAWWALAQDDRRAILEEQSRHIQIGLGYLPAVARRLYHCRDLQEPFDFLTWFEYAPEYAVAFEELVAALRETTEWQYIEREVDVRLTRESRDGAA